MDSAIQKGDRFVAVADILGFKSLLTLPLEEIAERVTVLLNGVGGLERRYVTSSDRLRSRLYRPNAANFSDSVILWSDIEPNLAQAFQGGLIFTKCLGDLVHYAFVQGIPIRIGVAFGETFIDPNRSILIGKPVADAFLLEEAQEWIGGALHFSVLRGIEDVDGIGVRYPVPLRRDSAETRCAALDWCFNPSAIEAAAIENAIDTCLMESPNDGVRRKYLNTQLFCNYRRQ